MGEFFALTLFGGTLWAIISIVLFLIILFASEAEKNGFYAFGSLIVFATVFYFWGSFEPILAIFTWKSISLYLVAGLIYASIRTFFEGRKLGEKIKNLPDKKPNDYPYESKQSKKDEFINNLKGNVFRWWFMWFISLIMWLLTDLIKDIWNFLYSKIKNFFNFILELGIKSVK